MSADQKQHSPDPVISFGLNYAYNPALQQTADYQTLHQHINRIAIIGFCPWNKAKI